MKNTMSNYPSEGVLHHTSETTINETPPNNSGVVVNKCYRDELYDSETWEPVTLKDGYWEIYFRNGNLHSKGNINNGVEVGEWNLYYQDGTLKIKGTFINGKEDGEWNLYYQDGSSHLKGTYNNGIREGEWVVYNNNGDISRKTTYVDDNVSRETEFTTDGRKLTTKTIFYFQ